MCGFVCGTCMYVYELTLVYSEYQHILIQTHTHTQDGGELFVGAVYVHELTLVGVRQYVTHFVVMVRLYFALSCVCT